MMFIYGGRYVLNLLVLCLVSSPVLARIPSKYRPMIVSEGDTNLLDVGFTGARSLMDFDANRSLGDLVPFMFKVEAPTEIVEEPHARYPKHGPLSQAYARLPFATEHVQTAPRPFRYIIIPTAGCAFLITLLVTGKLVFDHLAEGERRRVEEKKVFRPKVTTSIIYVILLFPMISFTSFAACIAPRNTVLLLVIARAYEAIALYAFFELLVSLMGDPEDAVAEMEKQEPFKIYGMPPLFCCYCCVPKMTMNRDRFITARNLVLQYCVVGPLTYLLHAWNDGYVPWFGIREPKQWVARHLVGHGAKIMSTLLCFWGLMQLYMATHFLLHEVGTTKKFTLIKLMLVLCELVHLTMYVAEKYYDFSDDPVYTDEVMTHAWIQMATCVLVMPMAMILPSAFPVKDLEFLDRHGRLWHSTSAKSIGDIPEGE